MILPEGFVSVAPGLQTEEGGESGAPNDPAAFPQPVSSFALAGCPFTPEVRRIGEVDYWFYGWEGDEEDLAKKMGAIQDFFRLRLPPPCFKEMRIIRSPRRPAGEIRFDETGTLLVPAQVSQVDLAFITAFLWIQPREDKRTALFNRKEIAKALSLYYAQWGLGETAYKNSLIDISEGIGGILPYAANLRTGPPDGTKPGTAAGPGAYLLSIFRRLVGDDFFDQILVEILNETGVGDSVGWQRWTELTARTSGEDFEWLFRRWASDGRRLDLAVLDFTVEERSIGQKVKLVLQNRGDLRLTEKVEVLFITDTGAIRKSLVVDRSRREITEYHQGKIIGVVLDPEMQWFDENRKNNLAYLSPPPYLAMPSEDNLLLAVAFHNRSGSEEYPLVVIPTDGENEQIYHLEHPAADLEWIGQHRLLVHMEALKEKDCLCKPNLPHYLIDTQSGRVECIESCTRVSASDSGRYLLLNDYRGKRWRHRLKDIDRKLVRSILYQVPYPLKWLPGTDFIMPDYPSDYRGGVEIFSVAGTAYPLSRSDAYHFAFHGFEGGLASLGRKNGTLSFYTRADVTKEPTRWKVDLTGHKVEFYLSGYGGIVFFKEFLENQRMRISRLDPSRGVLEILFEGSGVGMYDIFFDKGLLRKVTHHSVQGRVWEDIRFHRFKDKEGPRDLISRSPAPELILALVGNQRYLYYAEEIQAPWSALAAFNRYRFFRYDFLNRENRELKLGSWSP
jgi:hypothetical protein